MGRPVGSQAWRMRGTATGIRWPGQLRVTMRMFIRVGPRSSASRLREVGLGQPLQAPGGCACSAKTALIAGFARGVEVWLRKLEGVAEANRGDHIRSGLGVKRHRPWRREAWGLEGVGHQGRGPPGWNRPAWLRACARQPASAAAESGSCTRRRLRSSAPTVTAGWNPWRDCKHRRPCVAQSGSSPSRLCACARDLQENGQHPNLRDGHIKERAHVLLWVLQSASEHQRCKPG